MLMVQEPHFENPQSRWSGTKKFGHSTKGKSKDYQRISQDLLIYIYCSDLVCRPQGK